MKNGHCPKCNSMNVYVAKNGFQHEKYSLPLGGLLDGVMPVELIHYVCTDCGYHEAYVANPAVLEQITLLGKKHQRWLKVSANA